MVPAGQTLVRFETVGALDPFDYSYIIVINNSLTNPAEPYANISSFSNWNYVIAYGGSGSTSYQFTSETGAPTVTQIYLNPNGGVYSGYPITSFGPQDLIEQPTTALQAGAGGGFDIRFNRCNVLDKPNPTTGSLSGSTCPPFQYSANVWHINLFIVDKTGTIIDSMGSSGAQDTSFTYMFDTTTNINNGGSVKSIVSQASSTSAEIYGFQLFNAPYATPTPVASGAPTATPSAGASASPSPSPSPTATPV